MGNRYISARTGAIPFASIDKIRDRRCCTKESRSMKEQLPPHNIEAEQSVLCSMILDPDALKEAVSQLLPGDFYTTAHQKIFGSILSLLKKKEPVDLITLNAQIKRDGCLEETGGAAYLSKLTEETPIAVNIRSYCKIVAILVNKIIFYSNIAIRK